MATGKRNVTLTYDGAHWMSAVPNISFKASEVLIVSLMCAIHLQLFFVLSTERNKDVKLIGRTDK